MSNKVSGNVYSHMNKVSIRSNQLLSTKGDSSKTPAEGSPESLGKPAEDTYIPQKEENISPNLQKFNDADKASQNPQSSIDDEIYNDLSPFVRDTNKPVVTVFEIDSDSNLFKTTEPLEFNIIHTNDLHGRLVPSRNRGGMAYVAGKIEKLKQQDDDYIIVDAGDIAYAPPYSDRNRFNPMVEIMDKIGYDAVAAGNHEFQWESPKFGGPEGDPNPHLTDNLAELQRHSKFPLLCANAFLKSTGQRPDYLKPYIIKEVGDINVGVVGVTTDRMATEANPLVGEGWEIKDQSETLKKIIPQMKAEGAEVIVVVSHDNVRVNGEIISKTPGIDVVIGGHDHKLTEKPIMVEDPTGKKVPLVEAGGYGFMVGHLNIHLDPQDRNVTRITSTIYPIITDEIKPDPAIAKIVEKWENK